MSGIEIRSVAIIGAGASGKSMLLLARGSSAELQIKVLSLRLHLPRRTISIASESLKERAIPVELGMY